MKKVRYFIKKPNLKLFCITLFLIITIFFTVCKSGKLPNFSADFEELKYIEISSDTSLDNHQGLQTLDFMNFVGILNNVAPKLKSAIFKRNYAMEADEADVVVSFGQLNYLMRVDKAAEQEFLMETFLARAKSVRKLKVNTFMGGTRLEWAQFLQENPLEYFEFVAQNRQESDTFFNGFISILPTKLEQIGLNFWKNGLADELGEDKERKLLEVCCVLYLK